MATYFGYVERKADSYVNWAKIGEDMTNMLAKENKIREEKKAALDKASTEFGQTLSTAPQGESTTINEWALQYANQAQQARLMQDKLLKSGKLKLNDYLAQRQNLMDGTTQAFGLVKEFQQEYQTKWERLKQNKNQDLEMFLMAEAEGFGNFNQTQLYINPTDGKVNVAYKEKKSIDGKDVYVMSSNPNKFTDINSLRNRVKGQFDKFDVAGAMDAFVKSLGQDLRSIEVVKNKIGKTGLIKDVLDITQRNNLPEDAKGVVTNFEKAETKSLQAYLANDYNTSSILTNGLDICPQNGEPYTYTWSDEEAKKNPHLILLKNSSSGMPVPQFTEEQKKDALEYLRIQARLRYDYKEKSEVTPPLPDTMWDRQMDLRRLGIQERQLAMQQQRENRLRREQEEEDGGGSYAIDPEKIPSYVEYLKNLGIKGATTMEQYTQLGDDLKNLSNMGFDISYPPSENTNGKYTKIEISEPGGNFSQVIDMESPYALNQIKAFLIGSVLKNSQKNELNK